MTSWSFLSPSCSLWECTVHSPRLTYVCTHHITNHPPTHKSIPKCARSWVPRADAKETGLWLVLGKRSGPQLLQLPITIPHRLLTAHCHSLLTVTRPFLTRAKRSCWNASHTSQETSYINLPFFTVPNFKHFIIAADDRLTQKGNKKENL